MKMKIDKLHLKLNSLDEEIDEHGRKNSSAAIKEYKRIQKKIEQLEKSNFQKD